MERVLNQDERIRRAEELYERRRLQTNIRTSATVNVDNTNNKKFKTKLIIQFVICLVIYGTFYTVKNIPNLVSQDVMYKISDILEYDINLEELYNKFNSNVVEKEKNEVNESNTLIEETLSATDAETNNEVIENTVETEKKEIEEPEVEEPKVEEVQLIEESSGLSQMEQDAEYIKANYNFIKPLTGEITSRYGIRNPTVATVPKYHTGIDIARVIGTPIIASMDGTVELVSSIGDYGNHVKIVNGEVATLYAHCNKVYVTEGQKVTQGQEIAEVGDTGNVTGPHLHFEIRRNNQYVDPDLILNF